MRTERASGRAVIAKSTSIFQNNIEVNVTDAAYSDLFSRIKTIAIIGAKDAVGQPVNMVGQYLMQAGFTVVPVHPTRQNVWGLQTYKTLLDIPHSVDLINVFRASEFCLSHAEECLKHTGLPQVFWMQQGIESKAARKILEAKGVTVIEGVCSKVVHARIFPLGK